MSNRCLVVYGLLIAAWSVLSVDSGSAAEVPESRTIDPLSVGTVRALSESCQSRLPEEFWMHRKVKFRPEHNNVIEDADYLVRKQYWELDSTAVGTVTAVTLGEQSNKLRVRFESQDGWKVRALQVRDEVVTTQSQTVTETAPGAVTIQSNSTVGRVEGRRLFTPEQCGVIVETSGDVVFVDCPDSIVNLPDPQVGDTVIRGPDWFGFADGGNRRFGRNHGKPEEFAGKVIERNDGENHVDVRWVKTGRITACRFDHNRFYDVVLLEKADHPGGAGPQEGRGNASPTTGTDDALSTPR